MRNHYIWNTAAFPSLIIFIIIITATERLAPSRLRAPPLYLTPSVHAGVPNIQTPLYSDFVIFCNIRNSSQHSGKNAVCRSINISSHIRVFFRHCTSLKRKGGVVRTCWVIAGGLQDGFRTRHIRLSLFSLPVADTRIKSKWLAFLICRVA